MIFEKIKNFIRKNKKSIFIAFFIFFIFHFDLSFADGNSGATSQTAKEAGDSAIQVINWFIRFGSAVLALLTELAGWFLSPGWTTGKAIGFSYHLKELWIMISNVVYLMFAIILIWIAFMNILGKTGDWELKQAMPKFIVGVLIVPFSWMIVSAMIGLSSILTVSVLSLPRDSFPDTYSSLDDVKFYKTYTFNIGKSQGKNDMPIEVSDQTTFGQFFKEQNNIFGIMNIYTFGIMKIDSQGKLNFGDIKNGITSFSELTLKGIFDLLFFVIYFILMIALLMALFVRGVYIWFFMILSPFFGLMYFFGDKGPTKALSEKFSFEKFIGLAMMPVYVAGALAFGLLFILVAGKGMDAEGGKCDPNDKTKMCFKAEDPDSSIEFLGIKLVFHGSFANSGDAKEVFSNFKGSFAVLLLQVFGLAILWIAVMAALGSSELTKEVVAPIKQFGDSVGSLAAKAPTYMPLIPGPGGKMMSATELGQASSSLVGDINTHFTDKGSRIGHALSPFGDSISAKLDQINNSINKGDLTSANKINDVLTNKVKPELSKVSNPLLDAGTREKLFEILEKIFGASAIKKADLKQEKDPHNFAMKLKKIKLGSDAAPGAQDYINRVLKGKTEKEIVEILGLSGKLSSSSSGNSNSSNSTDTAKKIASITVNNNNIINNNNKIDKNKAKDIYEEHKEDIKKGNYKIIDNIGMNTSQEKELKKLFEDFTKEENKKTKK